MMPRVLGVDDGVVVVVVLSVLVLVVLASDPTAEPLITNPSIVALPEFIVVVSCSATLLTPLGSSIEISAPILTDPLTTVLNTICLLENDLPGLNVNTWETIH